MAKVNKKIIIGNSGAIDPDEFFGIAKFYGPDEATIDAFIDKLAILATDNGLIVEKRELNSTDTKSWKIAKV